MHMLKATRMSSTNVIIQLDIDAGILLGCFFSSPAFQMIHCPQNRKAIILLVKDDTGIVHAKL